MHRIRDYAFDWIAWTILAAIPTTIYWQSATSLSEQGVARGGPMENAALFPRIVASIMAVLVVWLAVSIFLGRVRKKSPLAGGPGTRLAFVATAYFITYLIVLPYAGYHLATPVLGFLMFWLLGIRPITAVAGGIALSLVTAFVFEGLLNVVLPVGVFDIALFG